jgi:uncharacterized protein (TIGR02453 family)
MKSTFKGYPAEGMKFLRDLKKNNDREWFNPRKELFDRSLKQPTLELAGAIHQEMQKFAPEYVGDPAKCMYRIYRDTRFSKNKTPYKTHVSALFWHKKLGKNSCASFYAGVSPEGIDVAGGLYTPEPDGLLAVRQMIAEDPDEFRATYETRKVKKLLGDLSGEALTRVPKGFSTENPAADLLKRKQYLLWTKLDAALATTPKLLGEVVSRFEAMTPLIALLNRPLLPLSSKRKRDEGFLR